MLTTGALRAIGADVDEGISRCMGNEAFYLRMVGMLSSDTHLAQLEEALARDDLGAAFEAAHALKGVLANLAVKSVLEPVSEMTELLRAHTKMDYTPLLTAAKEKMNRLLSLIKE
jgi:HPt (histidine-containing phosphotransfer) domain-containing protein